MQMNILCPNCNTPGMEDIDSEIFLCRTCVQIWEIEPDGSHIRCYSLNDEAYLEIECPTCTSRLVDIGTGEEGVCLTCAKVWDVTTESLSIIEEIKENKTFLDRVEHYRKKMDLELSNNNEVFEQCIQEILKADRSDALKLYELNALLTAKRS
ncbi:hypothetical protein ASD24_29720 [Paenibacillus sp. Root52]|uniref:hypothetical protein n=1 Tax=Paenibacillus sp. Root52 TaxID=1736552 RepID=UPI0006F3B1E4|nr:hypothetical protein [Paenibacillus sp. Root52]KQY83552.1 hypothetical protein ASD24_29720 [Paenibacillus sp. Root52]